VTDSRAEKYELKERGNMQLEEAMKEFESNHSKRFSDAEINKIHAVANELAVTEFKVFRDRVTDGSATLNIHRTMIVASEPFEGSVDRGPTPYVFFPHFFPFSGFTDRTNGQRIKSGVLEVFCASEFVWVPVNRECRCGDIHDEE
jgi:hypothetical protein